LNRQLQRLERITPGDRLNASIAQAADGEGTFPIGAESAGRAQNYFDSIAALAVFRKSS
jgi:hypothetical protein